MFEEITSSAWPVEAAVVPNLADPRLKHAVSAGLEQDGPCKILCQAPKRVTAMPKTSALDNLP